MSERLRPDSLIGSPQNCFFLGPGAPAVWVSRCPGTTSGPTDAPNPLCLHRAHTPNVPAPGMWDTGSHQQLKPEGAQWTLCCNFIYLMFSI